MKPQKFRETMLKLLHTANEGDGENQYGVINDTNQFIHPPQGRSGVSWHQPCHIVALGQGTQRLPQSPKVKSPLHRLQHG